MAPGYLNINLGWTYRIPQKISLTVSPFTGKLTFVLDDSLSAQGAYGVSPNSKVRTEGGFSISTRLTKKLMENITFKLRADVFTPYFQDFTIDTNLNGSIKMKVNNYITTSVSATLVYDNDVMIEMDDGTTDTAWQFRNMINVGLAFSW